MTRLSAEVKTEEVAVLQVEKVDNASDSDPELDFPQYTEEETKRILRKIDWRVVPILTSMYLIAFVDRANIGNAKVAGMNDDLKLQGMQYNIALTVFFIPYALLEVPSNIILKLTRPSIWMSSIMLAWGIVLTCMGLVHNFEGLVACRWFLGVAEAGFFPGATYLLTCWYKRYEVQSRMVFFYAGASLSGAFSGLLAYGIQHMEGVGGLAGWKWIFILEGIVTCICAAMYYFILPDNPQSASFLSEDERKFIIRRLQLDTGSGQGAVTNDDKLTVKFVLNAMKEWRIWFCILIYWANSIGVYGFTYTVPTVIKDLGYSAANAQLLTIPIYVAAMIFTTCLSVWSDKKQQRFPFIIGGIAVAIAGLAALLAVPKKGMPGVIYGLLFVVASGLYSFIIPVICWVANNLAPSSKRAVGMAMLISGGNLGGIAGSNIYLSVEAPYYWTGYGFSLAVCIMAFCCCFVLKWSFQRDNRLRDAMTEEEINSKYTPQQLLELGDRNPYFRYTL